MQNKNLQHGQEVQSFTRDTLEAITSGDILKTLLQEFETNKKNKRDQVVPILVQMGDACAGHLLDLLRHPPNPEMRVEISRTIAKIGKPAVPETVKRLQGGGPPAYEQDLIWILGKIGDQNHSEFLELFVFNDNSLVRREALKSLYAIGGKRRSKIFLTMLPTVDDFLKSDLVGMLGALNCREAVPTFLDILESVASSTSKEKIDLAEKICTVLGNFAAQQAVPALQGIVEQKGQFKGKGASGEKIRDAAAKALVKIRAATSQSTDGVSPGAEASKNP